MPEDKRCKKCDKKESQCDMPWVSAYGLCNECYYLFAPYITKALNKFLKDKKHARN
jgi:hypothetical protein